MTDETKINYKKTLNLPKTSFPMRANLAQNEPQTLKRWAKERAYDQIIKKNEDKPPFIFHDGPPYANGDIHLGHLLNKVLKDIVVRSQNMLGKRCEYIPGWDCHGLPIEHKVMTEIIAKKAEVFDSLSKEDRALAIRKECYKYASKFVKLQSKQMQRLLTIARYDDPYLTMNYRYEKRVLEVFSSLLNEGIVYRQLKPVHWSIANQTALAEAELEYKDKKDTSVYVNFQATETKDLAELFGITLSDPISFMIWTTTPWTLPANLAIALHESYTYCLIKLNQTYTIIAKDRLGALQSALPDISIDIIAETTGKSLLGCQYHHPFCDRQGPVVHADYVTLDDGTGLVHTAPGHGIEDYQTGLREKLDIYCPVLADGTFDDTVPEWLKGKLIWKANQDIVDHLSDSEQLVYSHDFDHSYPHDWRSKTPVIFRSTEQWFISVDQTLKSADKSLRYLATTACEDSIKFIPEWGKNRLKGMLDSRPDWCLSRQRAWGLPIPAFRLANGDIFMTPASVTAIGKCFEEKGSNAWFLLSPEELLTHYDAASDPDYPDNLDLSTCEKMYDIFDVWFESGSSWHAVLNEENAGYPADLYLEGSDQHRGWFHLSLLPALGVTQQPPFKQVLTHGFIVDKEGHKMSKSGGNALNVDDLLKDFGAEVARWWVSSLAFDNDIKVDLSFFDVAGESYRKIRNTLRFLLSNLSDLEKTEDIPTLLKEVSSYSDTSLEAHILSELSKLNTSVTDAYQKFAFRQAHTELYNFCNDTLSAFYCMAVKDRLYCDEAHAERRRQSQKTLWVILETLCRLLAPILPHTADEAYQAIYENTVPSIHLTDILSLEFTASAHWKTVLEVRSDVLKQLELQTSQGIENNLDAGVVLADPTGVLAQFSDDLADVFGVSRVTIDAASTGIHIQDLREEPRCERSWKRDASVKKRSDGTFLSDRDAKVVGILD